MYADIGYTDNGVGVIHTTGAKAVRLASKYAPLVPVLADLIARPDTPLAPHVKVRILGQLRTAQKRFAAIAPPAAAGPSALRPAADGVPHCGIPGLSATTLRA